MRGDFSSLWPAESDAFGQRAAVRVDGVGESDAALGVLVAAWHRARTDSARASRGERAARAHAPHAQGRNGASASFELAPAAGVLRRLHRRVQSRAPA